MFPRQPFATNAIYHSVTQPHHVMLLLAIYGCVKDGMTFDQCVWPCFTLLPPHLILNVSYEPFSLCRDKREALARRTFNVRQTAFCPWAFRLLVLVLRVHVQPYGRWCKVSAGCPESTVLLHGRPAGCGRPARNHLQQELGSSRSAERTRGKAVSIKVTSEILSHRFKLSQCSRIFSLKKRSLLFPGRQHWHGPALYTCTNSNRLQLNIRIWLYSS